MGSEKLTKQGVRDLDGLGPKRPRRTAPDPIPRICDHRRMRPHCPGGCGHWECPTCGLFWDDGWGG